MFSILYLQQQYCSRLFRQLLGACRWQQGRVLGAVVMTTPAEAANNGTSDASTPPPSSVPKYVHQYVHRVASKDKEEFPQFDTEVRRQFVI